MDGAAWRAKCGPKWTTPPTVAAAKVPSPAPPLPSQIPSPLPPLPLPPPPAGNQMDRSSQQFFHSFNTQNNLEAHSTVQEQLVFQTLNLDFARSVKTELSNSFLALLSGHSHQLSSSIAQLPHLNSTTAALHSHSGGIISCASRAQGKGSLSLSENYGGNSLCFGEISPLVESRPFLVSTSSKAQSLHNGHQVAGSQTHGSGCVKPVPKQACKVKNSGISGIGTSSMSSGRRTVNSFVNSSENHMLKVQAFPKVPTEARSALPSHVSAFLKAWPHVSCMNKAGELRVSDNGRLGILCFCHGLHMSVAKFCQHSGSPSVNPGEAVYLENGMTIVQWYKLYFGNMALPDGNGWEWPDDSLAKGVLVGNEGNKSPVFTKAPGTSGYFQAVSGLGRLGEPSKKSIYINRPHTVGQTTLNNLANNNANFAFQTKSLEGHNLPFESLTGLAQSGMPLPKNNIVQGKKESPDHVVLDASNLTMNKSEQTVWPSVVASNVGFMGKFGNLTSRYPYSETKKSSTHEHILRRDNSSSKAFVADREGSSSNIDLMLGQPSHHFCTPLSSFPTVRHPLHVGVMCSSQKAQLNQTLAERSDHHRETKKARTQLQYIQSEASSSNRGQPQHELSHADPKGLTDDPTKSSLISLFLSHLNYGGYNSSESTDIVNNGMQSVTRVPDAESLSAKCNSLDHTNEAAGIGKKSFSNSFNIFDIVDAGKGPGLVATNSCNVVKANHLHDKQTADTGDLTPVIGGNGMHSTSCDIRQSSLHFNQPHNILKIRPDVSHSTQHVKAPFLGNMNHCSHAIHNSINSVSYATDEAGSLNSRTPSSFTSPNFAHIQETTCALSHQRHIDRSEKMMDEDLRFLRHVVELPKQDQCVASLTKRPQHPIVCCLSAMGSQGNVCKDLVAPEESGRGTQCSIQAHPSNQVIRSVRPCSECYSGIGVENLSAKPGIAGPDECCNCTASAQTKSECSKEHNIQFSTCHVCGAADHPCLRFGRVLNSSSSGSVKHKMCNHKEQSPLFSGKCGCTVLSKSLGGCCFTEGDNPSDALIEQGDTRERTTPAYDEHFVFPDGKSLRVCQCECVKKHVLMKNKCHTGLWRDVPSKLQGHSDVPIPDKPAKKLEPSHLVRDLLVNTPKEFDGTQQVAELIDEQQMSSACSGSSAPAVTEVSVEVNDVDFGDMNIEDAKVMHDFVVDEGSGIEKCGSSDEATGIRECEEAMAMMEKVDPATCGYCLSSRLSGNLTDEHILKSSSKKRRTRNQNFFENITEENDNQTMQSERGRKIEKRKEQMKMNKLGVSVPESGFYSINSESPDCISHLKLEPSSPDRTKASPKSENTMQEASIFGRSLSAKRKRSVLRSRKTLSLDRSVNQRNTCGYEKMQLSNDDHCTRTLKISAEKAKKSEFSEDWVKPFTKQKENQKNGEKPLKYMSLSCIGKFHNHGMGTIGKNVRPVVCGESGIISNGLDGHQKPAKILPLKLILKKSKRCKITEYGGKPNLSSISKSKKVRASLDGEDCNEPLSSKLHSKDKDDSGRTRVKIDPSILLMSSTSKECSFDNERSIDECSVKICETDGVNDQVEKPALRHEHLTSQSKPKYKKVRKFHLSELMGKDKFEHPYSQSHGEDNSSKMIEEGNSLETPPTINIDDALVGTEHDEEKICSRFALSTNIRAEISSLDSQDHRGEACQVNTRRSSKDEKFQAFFVNSDAFCCVCGSSNQEDMNYLLECNRCLIRVHQACYGVPKIPRGYWFCRPCKINSENIACVLCGYGGGAMTRAVKSQTVVKSLLKAWKVETESNFAVPFASSEIINNEFLKTSSVSEASEFDKSVSVPSSQSQDCTVRCLDSLSNNLQAYNSIVAGVLDPSVTQWVHMVCGLWTPGTRCPNVYTMSAFDVSGASPARKKIVCSMCNRPGGSCIDCRVVDCSVQFHPWCAHQKGLLQSEIEGDDNENVGFYGRCIFHATQNGFHVDKQLGDAEAEILSSKDWTCARTEVFKGRKREDGFNPSHWKAYNDKGGCIVSQEQINAWLHINGQKTCARPVVKQGCSDIEYDFRKEYFRYKQSKGWKQLVVYKSGIHALGLYTSQFIYRGAMVVEYVGEIVGQRVADKREIEYQSGRRLQYKSACYFFRIDKEHIIDATCKGGIARFVNHSCLPNCVAKVISVRNEKKVVFFAERDIYPGEEITYDYHFNHEDEGQKIPCFCKSRNCRRYLN